MSEHNGKSMARGSGTGSGSALVFIPESVNFFNNLAGRRLADALRNLGWNVQLRSLRNYAGERADLAILVSIVELFVSCESPQRAHKQLDALKAQCPQILMWLLEPTQTRWF